MQTVNVKSLGNSPYLISMQPHDLIGRGSYACVTKAFNKDDPDEKLAAKTFDLSDSKKFESAMKELMIVTKIPSHENLVEYRKVKITSKNRLYIIMEQCRESLQQKLEKEQVMKQEQIWRLIVQFCEGYKALQQKSIVHRDIKPDNILIGYDNNYKISDFGLSDVISQIQQNEEKFKKPKGSLPFMAPQLLFDHYHQQNGSMIDVYSFGATLYYVCFKKYPFLSLPQKKIQHPNKKTISISIHDFLKQLKNNSLAFPNRSYSDKLISLISSCLQKNPRERCSWQFIYFSCQSEIKHKVKNNDDPKHDNLGEPQKNKLFKIVEISDTFLKNLSALDADMFCSLSNESVILIDHIEANIISKRQIIYFCDRLYYRLTVIHEKMQDKFNQPKLMQDFFLNLLILNYINCQKLDTQFERYYSVIDKNQYIKCLTSQKYICMRNLIRQDFQFISNTLKQQKEQIIADLGSSLNEFIAKVYEKCSCLIELLYQMELYEECKQVDELEKYLGGEDSILRRLRKNENALTQFDHSILNLSKDRLKQIISKQYICPFRKIDHQ